MVILFWLHFLTFPLTICLIKSDFAQKCNIIQRYTDCKAVRTSLCIERLSRGQASKVWDFLGYYYHHFNEISNLRLSALFFKAMSTKMYWFEKACKGWIEYLSFRYMMEGNILVSSNLTLTNARESGNSQDSNTEKLHRDSVVVVAPGSSCVQDTIDGGTLLPSTPIL